MVNRRMGNRSITSLRSRRRQTTVSHSRAGLNTVSRNRQCPATFLPSKPAPRPKISRRSPLSSARWPQRRHRAGSGVLPYEFASAVPITRKRWSKTQALESSYTAINEEFSSAASATDNDSSSAYDEGKKKLKTFKQDSDKLAAMKAVKKDKDVKEKYETFEQDRAKYERYMNDLAQTMPALMKMTHTCTKLPKFDSADMSSYYRDLSKALESCAADAGDLAKVPIKSYAEYGADMQESVSKKKDIVDQMADLNLNDIEYGSADYEKLQDLHAKMSDIDSPTLDQSDLQKAAKEADLSGSLKDLETTLSEKIK